MSIEVALLSIAILGSTQVESVPLDGCLPVEVVQQSLQTLNDHWYEWTRAELAKWWPAPVSSKCPGVSEGDCYIFGTGERVVGGEYECATAFSWDKSEKGAVLRSVAMNYSTQTRSAADRVATLLVEAIDPPDGSLLFSKEQNQGRVDAYQWETRDGGTVFEVFVINLEVSRFENVWRVALEYTRFLP